MIMEPGSFYLDTCIWLNLFKKEGDPAKGMPYWKITKGFIESVEKSNSSIIISTIVLKELSFKLGDEYGIVRKYFDENKRIIMTKTTHDDYSFARTLESELRYRLSFFDCLHIAICKRLKTTLITRDKELIFSAKGYVSAKKPEDLIS